MTAIQVKLSDSLLQKLRSRTGITAEAVAEALGVGVRQAAHLLVKCGAKRDHTAMGKYRLGAE